MPRFPREVFLNLQMEENPSVLCKVKKKFKKAGRALGVEIHHRCTTAKVLYRASHTWGLSDTDSLLSRHTGSFFPIFHGFNRSHMNRTWESHTPNMPLLVQCFFALIKEIILHSWTSLGHSGWMANYFTGWLLQMSLWLTQGGTAWRWAWTWTWPWFPGEGPAAPRSKEMLIVHLPLRVVIYIFSAGLLPRKGPSINLPSNTLTALLRNVSHTLSQVIQSLQIPFFPQTLCLPDSTMDTFKL